MRTIYFIRHAESDISVKKDDIRPLTDKGFKQSFILVDILREKNIRGIYSSPHLRCVQTVRPLSDFLDIEIVKVPSLIERKVSTANPWVKNFTTFAERQWTDFDFALPGGESLNDVKKRSVSGLEEILKHSKGDIIVCGHGTSLSTIFNHYQSDFLYPNWKKLRMPEIISLRITEHGHQLTIIEGPKNLYK